MKINIGTKKTGMAGWVFISGATGGLGKAFAVECASRGWKLFLTDQRSECLETLASGLRAAYAAQVVVMPCDMTDSTDRSRLYTAMDSAGIQFGMMINVAGLDYEGAFLDRSREQIRTILRVNIESTVEITHALLERRDPRSRLRIITVASLAAFQPMPVKATYAASKRFLLDFSLALREEVRPLGATVTVLCPAGLPTTPETIRGIAAQGWLGQITTQDIGRVAARTINAALRGQAVVIPGLINQFIRLVGELIPPTLTAYLIGRRWQASHQRRQALNNPAEVVNL
jgi:uncharacterized protein